MEAGSVLGDAAELLVGLLEVTGVSLTTEQRDEMVDEELGVMEGGSGEGVVVGVGELLVTFRGVSLLRHGSTFGGTYL